MHIFLIQPGNALQDRVQGVVISEPGIEHGFALFHLANDHVNRVFLVLENRILNE